MYQAFQYAQISGPAHTPNVAAEPATALLNLPLLADTVPLLYIEKDEVELMEMARSMAQAGIIRKTDRDTDRTLQQTLIDVMSREINEVAGDMTIFNIHCQFAIGNDNCYDDMDGPCMTLYIHHEDYIPQIRLDSALAHLNTIGADLGQTLYAVMEQAARVSLQIHTFASVIGRFPYELQIDPDMRECMDEDEGVEHFDIDAMALQFPFPWVPDARAVLSPRKLASIAKQKNIPDDVVNALAAAIDIGNCYKTGAGGIGVWQDCPPVHAVASIQLYEHDPTEELMDDVINTANQCSDSYTSSLHEEVISVSPDGDFPAAWRKIVAGFRLLGALDRLVASLDKINKGLV